MRRTRGLSTRLIIAIGVLAALHLTVFVVLLTTLHEVGVADHDARSAGAVSRTASDARIALARQDVPGMRASATELATAGREGDEAAATTLARELRRYAAAHAHDRVPHVETPWARAIDDRLTTLEMHQRAARGSERDHASQLTRVAWIAGATGVAATLLCAVGMLLYLRRALLAPLRGVAGAARGSPPATSMRASDGATGSGRSASSRARSTRWPTRWKRTARRSNARTASWHSSAAS